MPKITVAMPVYNDAVYLREAVNSILAQTYKDFELLIVDDGSTDGSLDIISSYRDRRIRVIRHKDNRGRPHARNTALDAADSEYFAWMDGDDISLPERLSEQIAFMDAHHHVSVCSTWVQCFGEKTDVEKMPTKSGEISACCVFAPALCNPASCLRLSDIRKHDIHYDVKLLRAQDFAFWGDLLLGAQAVAANLPKVLFRWRYFHRPSSPEWHAKALLGHIFPHLKLQVDTRMAYLHTDLIYQPTHTVIENYSIEEALFWLDTVWLASPSLAMEAREHCRVMLRNHAERLMARSSSLLRHWTMWRRTALGASWSAPFVLGRILLRKALNAASEKSHDA
jgi:Glycosyltransferases involved in cell wall biogenesis